MDDPPCLTEVRYQENYREGRRLGEVAFNFDTRPDLPAFLEIEGPDETSVRQAAAFLELDYSEARFGSVDEIHKSEAGRDILAEHTPPRRGGRRGVHSTCCGTIRSRKRPGTAKRLGRPKPPEALSRRSEDSSSTCDR